MNRYHLAAALAGAVWFGAGPALAVEQPHTEAALGLLEQAKHEILISDSSHTHGGHAGEATRLIDEAIAEVHKAIQYRDEHPQ
jgi:hypothetical protein